METFIYRIGYLAVGIASGGASIIPNVMFSADGSDIARKYALTGVTASLTMIYGGIYGALSVRPDLLLTGYMLQLIAFTPLPAFIPKPLEYLMNVYISPLNMINN